MGYATTNPYTNQVEAEFPYLEDDALESALTRAHLAFEDWRAQSFGYRADIIARAADILRQRPDDFARLLTLEMGKLLSEARDEVELTASILRYYADNAERFLAPERLSTSGGDDAMVVNEPLGVLVGVQPWNFPYYQLSRIAGANLMSGNVLMVKHAANVPQSAAAFETLLREAGAPEGVYTNLYASKDQVSWLINDPRVQGVMVTGSEAAGSAVAARAGEQLKKSTLELGGSDPFIVLADADLEKTVNWAVTGRMTNTGQSCIASKRIIVHDDVASEFLDRYVAALEDLKAGDPFDPETTLAPLCAQEAADTVKSQVDEAVNNGARKISIHVDLPETGAFVAPAILTDITKDNPIYDQEIFGPVAMFFRAADDDDAVRIANDSSFGLGGAVFTEDLKRGVDIATRIETGMVFVNQPTWTKPELPFGGIKRSGYGYELSDLGMHEFVNKKLINVASIRG